MTIKSTMTIIACFWATSLLADPLTEAVAGKTLVPLSKHYEGVIEIHADGRLTGLLTGTWSVQSGQWCTDLIKPEMIAGQRCQEVELGEGTIGFVRGDGSISTYTIR